MPISFPGQPRFSLCRGGQAIGPGQMMHLLVIARAGYSRPPTVEPQKATSLSFSRCNDEQVYPWKSNDIFMGYPYCLIPILTR